MLPFHFPSAWLTPTPPCNWHGITCADGSVSVLSLSGNQLAGGIPSEISSLSNLQELYLALNQLTGPIPPQIGDLSSLEILGLSENLLSGSLPKELGNLQSLTQLGLSENQLTGVVPEITFRLRVAVMPVYPSNEFPPSYDLPDEPLHASELDLLRT